MGPLIKDSKIKAKCLTICLASSSECIIPACLSLKYHNMVCDHYMNKLAWLCELYLVMKMLTQRTDFDKNAKSIHSTGRRFIYIIIDTLSYLDLLGCVDLLTAIDITYLCDVPKIIDVVTSSKSI